MKPDDKKDKVIILGTIPTWEKAPLNDKSWEVWGMNSQWDWWGKYATRWFEIHPMSVLKKEWKSFKWLKDCPIPVYMIKHYADVPNSIPYPIKDIMNHGFMRQFSSTFCYQLALAIHEGFKTIGLYGVDFSKGSYRERWVEWGGLLYWLGVASGLGIKIVLPDASLFHKYLYGLEYWKETKDVRTRIMVPLYFSLLRWVDGIGLGEIPE